MSYTPLNAQVFSCCYAAVLAGMGASNRTLSNPSPATYSPLSTVAGAFAQEFDTQYGGASANVYQLTAIQSVVEGAWSGRVPPITATFELPTTYSEEVRALLALIQSGSLYLEGQGITPPTPSDVTTFLAQTIPIVPTTGTLVLGTLAVGQSIVRTSLVVTTVFNSDAPRVQLGTSLDPSAFLDLAPLSVGTFNIDEVSLVTVADTLQVVVTSDGATAGTASILYELVLP